MNNDVKEQKNVKEAIVERTVTLILAGFGVVAALAWNDAIQSLVNFLFPLQKNTVIAKFFYALLITIIITVISLRLKKIK